jgi:hypothetical protein
MSPVSIGNRYGTVTEYCRSHSAALWRNARSMLQWGRGDRECIQYFQDETGVLHLPFKTLQRGRKYIIQEKSLFSLMGKFLPLTIYLSNLLTQYKIRMSEVYMVDRFILFCSVASCINFYYTSLLYLEGCYFTCIAYFEPVFLNL